MDEKVIKNMNIKDNYSSKFATKNENAIRLLDEKTDFRSSFFRDIDRIIYSLSYARYIDKTQVFSNINNDHVSKRMIHVQMVSKIARTIGRALNLNEDLIEAIALGHDLGHVPFGHPGEAILNKISYEYLGRYFNHNVHSVRVLKDVELNGIGSNVTVQVLDGILCHNGEFVSQEYYPMKKTKEEFLKIYEDCYTNPKAIEKLRPMTLEGCIVRISDIIGYIGRDIEDAIRIGVIKKEELPSNILKVLGTSNKEIINTIITDVVNNSLDKPYIKISDEIYKAIKDLKKFNYQYIYAKANTKDSLNCYENMFRTIFKSFLDDLNNSNYDSKIYKVYLNYMSNQYIKNNSNEQIVIDFIAGMTDDYCIKVFEEIKNA